MTARRDGFLFDRFVSDPDVNRDYPFGDITVPTMVISAVDDPMANASEGAHIGEAIPGARLIASETGGHPLLGLGRIVEHYPVFVWSQGGTTCRPVGEALTCGRPVMGDVTMGTPRGGMPGYLSTPADEGPWPGVVVLHDAFGISQVVRDQADWLASAGYLTLTADRCFWDAARAWLAGQPPVGSASSGFAPPAVSRCSRPPVMVCRIQRELGLGAQGCRERIARGLPDRGQLRGKGPLVAGYHEPSAKPARQWIVSFFDRHLKEPG